jgi:hypothetical protein
MNFFIEKEMKNLILRKKDYFKENWIMIQMKKREKKNK